MKEERETTNINWSNIVVIHRYTNFVSVRTTNYKGQITNFKPKAYRTDSRDVELFLQLSTFQDVIHIISRIESRIECQEL